MSEWKHTLYIKHLFAEAKTDETARETARSIATELKESKWYFEEETEARRTQQDAEIVALTEEFGDVDCLERFDECVLGLYDLADADRIWIA